MIRFGCEIKGYEGYEREILMLLMMVESRVGSQVYAIQVTKDWWAVLDWESPGDKIPTYYFDSRGGYTMGPEILLGKPLPLRELHTDSEAADPSSIPGDGDVSFGDNRASIGQIIPPEDALKIVTGRAPQLARLPASLIARAGIAGGLPAVLKAINRGGRDHRESGIHVIELLRLADRGLFSYAPIQTEEGGQEFKWSLGNGLHSEFDTKFYLPDHGGWHAALRAAMEHFANFAPLVRDDLT